MQTFLEAADAICRRHFDSIQCDNMHPLWPTITEREPTNQNLHCYYFLLCDYQTLSIKRPAGRPRVQNIRPDPTRGFMLSDPTRPDPTRVQL